MSSSRMLLSPVVFFAPFCACQSHADLFSDEGSFTSLLQLQHWPRTSSRTSASSSTRTSSATGTSDPFASGEVTISPTSGSMKFVGRHHIDTEAESVLFDAIGFEVQFQVTGATEVKIALSQRISGPHGWWHDAHVEDDWADGCFNTHPEGWTRPDTASLWMASSSVTSRAAMFPPGSQPQHFLVYVDGEPQLQPLDEKSRCTVCTFDTSDAASEEVEQYTVARGLDSSKTYDIRIVKTSEPDFTSAPATVPNWLALHSLVLDGGSVELPHTSRIRRIEFVGDSWMSGYCDTCNGSICKDGSLTGAYMEGTPSDTYRWGSYALAWPHVLCETLEAECYSTLLSGVGVHCITHPHNENGDCSQDETLQSYWQRTLASEPSISWDFGGWTPEMLIAAVSTNEHWDDYGADHEAILRGYEDFLDSVYERYTGVHVLFVCLDPQVESMCKSVKKMVKKRKHSGSLVSLLSVIHHPEFSQQKNCCGHPDEHYHFLIKRHVAMKVRKLMGWRDDLQ